MASYTAFSYIDSYLTERSALEVSFSTIALIFLFSATTAAYNLYFHPVSSYPGPRLAAATRLWYCWHSVQGNLPFAIHAAHMKYGNTIRIAPDELSYIDPKAWNDIMGHQTSKGEIMKDPLFYSTTATSQDSILNADKARHGYLRRQMSHGFSEKALRAQEEVIRSYADLLMSRLTDLCNEKKNLVNMVSWYNFFTFDVTGALVFGESFDCLTSRVYNPWVKNIFDSAKFGIYQRVSRYWPLLTPLAKVFLPLRLQEQRKAQREMGLEKAKRRKALDDGRQDLMSGFLKPESGITEAEYNSTAGTLIIAGSETTATLMSGATFYLLNNPDKFMKLVTEVRESFTSAEQINFNNVTKLPYLLACLNEALRIYPPVPDALPRNTGPNPEIICGKLVPPHTVVRITQFAAYRSPDHFVSADEFIPERWLPEQKGFESDKKEVLQPFHVGPRNCLGRNLAYFEMRLVIALLVWHFELELCPISKHWDKQKVFFFWDKPDLVVKLSPRAF